MANCGGPVIPTLISRACAPVYRERRVKRVVRYYDEYSDYAPVTPGPSPTAPVRRTIEVATSVLASIAAGDQASFSTGGPGPPCLYPLLLSVVREQRGRR